MQTQKNTTTPPANSVLRFREITRLLRVRKARSTLSSSAAFFQFVRGQISSDYILLNDQTKGLLVRANDRKALAIVDMTDNSEIGTVLNLAGKDADTAYKAFCDLLDAAALNWPSECETRPINFTSVER